MNAIDPKPGVTHDQIAVVDPDEKRAIPDSRGLNVLVAELGGIQDPLLRGVSCGLRDADRPADCP